MQAGAVLELGAGKARAEHHCLDAAATELLVDGLGEAEHEGLGRGVGRDLRARLEAAEGRDVDDAARTAWDHHGKGGVGEANEGHDVQLDLADLRADGQVVKAASGSEAGVVDEEIDRPRAVDATESLFDCGALRRIRKVRREDLEVGAA